MAAAMYRRGGGQHCLMDFDAVVFRLHASQWSTHDAHCNASRVPHYICDYFYSHPQVWSSTH